MFLPFIVRDLWWASLVRHGVRLAPFGGDISVVITAVFSLDEVTHDDEGAAAKLARRQLDSFDLA